MFEVQKSQLRRRAHSRFLPKPVEPFFSAFLVVVSLFMAVMMFGAGSWIGGILFSLVLIPTAIVVWDEFFGPPEPVGEEEPHYAADDWRDSND